MESPQNDEMTFIGKDDGKVRRVSLFIQGKHGKIGLIRPDKPSTEQDRAEFLKTLAEVAIRSAALKPKEAQE